MKDVSKTLSKPMTRRAAPIWPVVDTPGSSPNTSPIATRTAGATCGDDELLRVVEGLPHLFDLRFRRQGAGGADAGALAAVDAFDVVQVLAEGGDHDSLGAPVGEVYGADRLYLGADPHAVAAQDALVRVPDERRGRAIDRARLRHAS